MTSQRLTIFLLTADVTEPADAIDVDAGLTYESHELNPSSTIAGAFYSKSNPPATPAWARYVEPLLTGMPDVNSASASGVLIVAASGRYFALTFGFGRNLLDQTKIERRFGLKVALNRIDAKQIRSLDTKTFEDMVVSRSTQTSKNAEQASFGVDAARDLLRAVTGRPVDDRLGRTITGADALVLTTKVPVQDLKVLLAELLTAYEDDAYKADFAWIDHLAEIKDPALVGELDDLLVQQLRAGDTTSSHLATPDNLAWDEVQGFKIEGAGDRIFEDLDLGDYLDGLGPKRSQLKIELLKSRKVRVGWIKTDTFDTRWPVYSTLVSEQELAGNLYALIEGRWFAISRTLVEEVDGYLAMLPSANTVLPAALEGEHEDAYNTRAASLNSDLLLLDRQMATAQGARSTIEFCDLLASNGELIHVKRKSRSATLSHLFAQGGVSASTLFGDGGFRDQVRDRLSQVAGTDAERWLNLVPDSATEPERTRYKVHFAVLTGTKGAGVAWLPFFSKLNLMQTAKQIRGLGPEVMITRVPLV